MSPMHKYMGCYACTYGPVVVMHKHIGLLMVWIRIWACCCCAYTRGPAVVTSYVLRVGGSASNINDQLRYINNP